MRKILISIVLALLLCGVTYLAIEGWDQLKIVGIKDIIQKNDKIDSDNKELANLINITYNSESNKLQSSATTLEQTKNEYEELALLNASVSAPGYAMQTDKYEIDYLWTRLGNFATEHNVVIKIELTRNSRSEELYDLDFKVTGSYVGITDFIYAIENDSKLGFKIESFSMFDAGDGKIEGDFSCRGISIDVGEVEAKVEETSSDSNTNTTNSTSTNTTNSNTSNTSNTTNTTSNEANTTDNEAQS